MPIPALGAADAANDQRMAQLARAIEYEIIPRLMLAHRAGPGPVGLHGEATQLIGAPEVRRFAEQMLSQDEAPALATIRAWRARGISVERLYMDALAPAARHLGRLWEEDACNFTDVTVGLGRLQRVLRELSPELHRSDDDTHADRRILLLPSPGDQHTFGLVMVGDFFRCAGWDVSGGAWAAGADAASMVAGEWFDVIGFSVGAEVNVPRLAATIAEVRRVALNREIAVIAGGPYFSIHPDGMGEVGADGVTMDGREAPSLAATLLVGRVGRRER